MPQPSITEIDVIKGSQSAADRYGFQDRRMFRADNLTPGPGIRYQAHLTLQNLLGIGVYSPHPVAPNCYVTNVATRPFAERSKTSVILTVDYGPPQLGAGGGYYITVTGANGMRNYNIGPDGKPFDVSYINLAEPAATRKTQHDIITLPLLSPNTVISYTWSYQGGPLALNRQYRRKLNADVWNGYPARTVLCRGITAEPSVGLTTWLATAIFEADQGPDGNTSGWDQIGLFRDANNGLIPKDIDDITPDFEEGNGWARFKPYGTTAFGPLNLPQIG